MKTCIQCHETFLVTDRDRLFYEKIALPEPTLCPLCRQRRRFAFRNERHLYRRKCNGSGKEIISMYPEEAPCQVYAQDVWWQGNWDAISYGEPFDFQRPFFEQFQELMRNVPRVALFNMNGTNSDYCNFTGDVKNSYLIFGSVYSEDCYYGSPYYSRNCVDTLVIRDCELCYECIDCRKLYNCFYCQDCNNSNDLLYCFDLQGCSDCISCAGLRKKKYCIGNQQLSKEEYFQRKKAINFGNREHRKKLETEMETLKKIIPRQAMQGIHSENVSGSHIFHSKNTFESFFADRCEDSAYVAQVVDLKDCYDNNYTEENELCYEYLGMYGTRKTFFSLFCRHANETYYSDYCINCEHIFGCSNLRDKKYCILNKQYSREEYEKLVPRIIEYMKKTGEWGEFFPMSISPFAYNETVAQEYFPVTREEAEKLGVRWKEDNLKEFQSQRVVIPDDIKEVPDSICYEILACEITGRNFRIIPQELDFYRRMNLPIPRRHPDQRHADRIAKRNPRKLWKRMCDQCKKEIVTSYAPGTPAKVYCEECYLKEMY